MSKLYSFSTRKYQHHIGFALDRLTNLTFEAEANGNQAQANYYRQKHAELSKRAAVVFTDPVIVKVPYDTWKYLMAVTNWAVEQGSGIGYL